MINISGIIISKNEEQVIENALRSLSFCDEILLIDNGSSDKTIEIAKKYNAKIIVKEKSDFSTLRNIGKDEAQGKYIFYLDADEVVSDELRKSILFEIRSNSSDAAYVVKRKNYYLGKHEWPNHEEILRLFKKENLIKWEGKIHESPKVEGYLGKLDGYLIHYTHRNLSQMLNKTIEWSDAESKLRLDSNHPKMSWWRFPRVMLSAFLNSYVKQKGYKMGTAGLVESFYQSFSMFVTYAKLWELQTRKKS